MCQLTTHLCKLHSGRSLSSIRSRSVLGQYLHKPPWKGCRPPGFGTRLQGRSSRHKGLDEVEVGSAAGWVCMLCACGCVCICTHSVHKCARARCVLHVGVTGPHALAPTRLHAVMRVCSVSAAVGQSAAMRLWSWAVNKRLCTCLPGYRHTHCNKKNSPVQTPPKQAPLEQAVPLGLGAGTKQVPVDRVQAPGTSHSVAGHVLPRHRSTITRATGVRWFSIR